MKNIQNVKNVHTKKSLCANTPTVHSVSDLPHILYVLHADIVPMNLAVTRALLPGFLCVTCGSNVKRGYCPRRTFDTVGITDLGRLSSTSPPPVRLLFRKRLLRAAGTLPAGGEEFLTFVFHVFLDCLETVWVSGAWAISKPALQYRNENREIPRPKTSLAKRRSKLLTGGIFRG